MRLAFLALIACVLALTGCGAGGGGGGGSGGGGGGGGGDGTTPVVLGTRDIQVATVKVTEEFAGVPVGKLQYLLELTPNAGYAAITKVEAGIGGDDPPTAYVEATAVAGATNAWRLLLDKPVTWPTNPRAYGRVTDAEGNVCESGPTDFGTTSH